MGVIGHLLFGRRPDEAMRRNGRIVISRPPARVRWRSVRPRDETLPVRAAIAEENAALPNGHGKLQARNGRDVIVSDGGGDQSVVRRDIFERTYEPLGGGLYRKRDDVMLRYFTLDRPALIETLEGPQEAAPGDWIMQGVAGELWPVSRDKALEKYQPV